MELLREAWIGWSGVKDEAGAEVAYSEEVRDRMLGIPFVLAAVAGALLEAMTGRGRRWRMTSTSP